MWGGGGVCQVLRTRLKPLEDFEINDIFSYIPSWQYSRGVYSYTCVQVIYVSIATGRHNHLYTKQKPEILINVNLRDPAVTCINMLSVIKGYRPHRQILTYFIVFYFYVYSIYMCVWFFGGGGVFQLPSNYTNQLMNHV